MSNQKDRIDIQSILQSNQQKISQYFEQMNWNNMCLYIDISNPDTPCFYQKDPLTPVLIGENHQKVNVQDILPLKCFQISPQLNSNKKLIVKKCSNYEANLIIFQQKLPEQQKHREKINKVLFLLDFVVETLQNNKTKIDNLLKNICNYACHMVQQNSENIHQKCRLFSLLNSGYAVGALAVILIGFLADSEQTEQFIDILIENINPNNIQKWIEKPDDYEQNLQNLKEQTANHRHDQLNKFQSQLEYLPPQSNNQQIGYLIKNNLNIDPDDIQQKRFYNAKINSDSSDDVSKLRELINGYLILNLQGQPIPKEYYGEPEYDNIRQNGNQYFQQDFAGYDELQQWQQNKDLYDNLI